MRLPVAFYDRVQAELVARIAEQDLDGLLVTTPGDIAYLAGFFYAVTERPVYLWIGADGDRFCLIPRLDEEYASAQDIQADVVTYFEYPGVVTPEANLAAELQRRGHAGARIGFSPALSTGALATLREVLPGADWTSTSTVGWMRRTKHPEEIEFHRKAGAICDEMLAAGRSLIEDALWGGKPLPSEGSLARHVISHGTELMHDRFDHVVYTTKLAGGLVYAGPNSARPHGLPSSRRLAIGDTLILSLGAAVASRFVESERTFVIGEPTPEQEAYFSVALAAQEVGVQGMTLGRTCAEVNAESLDVIRNAGMGEYIQHRLGHGIGIAQHEAPWIDDGDSSLLEAGMVLSSEPGIYVPGHGGYRISDTVLTTAHGPERLTRYPRTLEQNVIPA